MNSVASVRSSKSRNRGSILNIQVTTVYFWEVFFTRIDKQNKWKPLLKPTLNLKNVVISVYCEVRALRNLFHALCLLQSRACCRAVLMCRDAVIHFQVQAAAVQSHFNTNCLRSHKCACARQLTSPVPACNATLVAVHTKYQLLSQP